MEHKTNQEIRKSKSYRELTDVVAHTVLRSTILGDVYRAVSKTGDDRAKRYLSVIHSTSNYPESVDEWIDTWRDEIETLTLDDLEEFLIDQIAYVLDVDLQGTINCSVFDVWRTSGSDDAPPEDEIEAAESTPNPYEDQNYWHHEYERLTDEWEESCRDNRGTDPFVLWLRNYGEIEEERETFLSWRGDHREILGKS